MEIESLIFAAVIGLTIYLFMRRIKIMKVRKRLIAEQAASGEPPEDPGSMPRLGNPGTITREQTKLLKENDFEPSRLWSTEEAKLILDAVTYQRAVIYMATGEADPLDRAGVGAEVGQLFFVEEVLRHVIEEAGETATIGATSATTLAVPAGVREVIARRVKRLSAEAAATLSAASGS